ncbi:SDR family oxidoreductase [Arthrobacter sp. 92]|uniref:SDR family oxidoreductase n=1 Tax=Arthrobacter sp. 92 TaxID=3418175 RepID=UPI003CFFB0C2
MKTTGNTVLITGGTSGIGKAFAQHFLGRGNTVIICGRRNDRLEELKARYPDLVTIQCDLIEAASRENLVRRAIQECPDLNMLINNAGIQLTADLTNPIDLSSVEREIVTNLIAPIHLSSLVVEQLRGRAEPAIVNISSGLAYTPIAFMPVYCATKAAVHSWSLSLRKQLENTGIRVYEIAPPSVDSELGHERRENRDQTHGGMPVNEFINEAIKALESNTLQAAIGQAASMMDQRDALFERLNSHF